MADNNLERFVDAGIIDVKSLSQADRSLISSLSEQEVTTLIAVATRLYPNDPTALGIQDLRTGQLRICLPL
jgi:hypothetical protein